MTAQLKQKNKFLAVMGVLLIGSMAIFGAFAVQTATASHSTNVIYNETYTVNNDTVETWISVTDTNNSDVHLKTIGVESDGTETELKNETVNTGNNTRNVSTYRLTDTDRSNYEHIRVEAVGAEAAAWDSGYKDEVHNNVMRIDSDTDSVWADVSDTNGTKAVIKFVGINADGEEYRLSTRTVSPDNTTASESYLLTSADHEDFQEIRVVIEAQQTTGTDSGLLVAVSGGSTSGNTFGFLSGQTAGVSNGVIVIVVLAVAILAWKGGKE